MLLETIATSATDEMRGRVEAINKRLDYHQRALSDAISARQDAEEAITRLTALRDDYLRIINGSRHTYTTNVYYPDREAAEAQQNPNVTCPTT